MIWPNADKKDARSFVGTPSYLAPEILIKSPYSTEVDWWSLAVLMYELRTSFLLFNGRNENEVFKKIGDAKNFIISEKFTSSLFHHTNDPTYLQNLLSLMLNRDPNKRLAYRLPHKLNNLQKIRKIDSINSIQPLDHDYFKQGLEMIKKSRPPLRMRCIADFDETRKGKNDMYHGRFGTHRRRKNQSLLPPCRDRVDAEENEAFEGFGYPDSRMKR